MPTQNQKKGFSYYEDLSDELRTLVSDCRHYNARSKQASSSCSCMSQSHTPGIRMADAQDDTPRSRSGRESCLSQAEHLGLWQRIPGRAECSQRGRGVA